MTTSSEHAPRWGVDRRRWIALGAAVVGLVAAMVAFVGPADAHTTRVDWRPARDGLERPLALLASHPEHLRFALDCDTVRSLERETVLVKTTAGGLFTGALEVAADAERVRARVGGTDGAADVAVPPTGDCTVVVRFDALDDERGQVSVRAGRERALLPVPFVRPGQQFAPGWPRVAGLHADAVLLDASDARVSLETRIWGSTPTGRQIAALVVAVLFLALAIVLVLARGRRDRDEAPPPEETTSDDEPVDRSPWVAGSDVFVLIVAIAALVVAPPVWDDGWVRTTVDGYSSLGVFSNFYQLADWGQIVGYWWQLLLRPWHDLGDPLAFSRLIPFALIVGTWWTLRRAVLDRVVSVDDRRLARAIAALVFGVGAVAYMMTFRAEPLAALLLAGTIGAIVRFARLRDVASLVAIAILVAFAVSSHQTGFVVPFAALAVLPSAWRWCRERETGRRVVTLATVGAVGMALSAVLVGLDTDLGLTRTGASSFRAHNAYRTGVLENAIRRIDILRTEGTLHRLWPLLAVLALVAFLVIGRGVRSNLARLAGYSASLAFLGLLVTSSFWPSHFGALVPGVALLGAITVTHMLVMPRGRAVCLVGLGVVLAAIVAWSMHSTEKLGVPGELSELSWGDLPHLETWHWIALTAVAAGLGALWFVRREASLRARGAVMGAATFLLVAPLLMAGGLLVADTAQDPKWSYGIENLKTLAGRDSCGAADVLDTVTSTAALAEVPIDRWPLPSAAPDGYPSWSRQASVPPVPQVWGTYDPSASAGAEPDGTVATPWFDVTGQPEVVYWSAGDAQLPNRLRAEVVVDSQRGEGRRVRLPAERPLDTPWWAFHRVELPDDARALRLVLTDRDTDATSWLAVTAPVVPTYTSFTAVTEGEDVWRDAYLWYTMPCRSLPAATGGVIQPFRWSLGPPGENGVAIVEEYPTIERGCVFPERRGWPDLHQAPRLCAFEFVLPEP